VLSGSKIDFNNLEAKSAVRGLTIDTGRGNPGATGLVFFGANANDISDLTVKSGDGMGKNGIYMVGASQFYMHDVTVDGFDVGIGADHQHVTNLAIEHVTLRNQKVAGVRLGDATSEIRDLYSINSVPAILHTGVGADSVIIESKLTGGSSGNAALHINGGVLFARGVQTSGYGSAVKKGATVAVAGPNIDEYVSHPMQSLFGATRSLALPIEEVPQVLWPSADQWAVVQGNSTAAVQAAFNSGKPGVLFTLKSYNIGTVTVPASVKRVNFTYGHISGKFRIAQDASDPVLFEDGDGGFIESVANRPVVITHMKKPRYTNTSLDPSDKLFLNAASALGEFGLQNQKVWARMINTEPKDTLAAFTWDNATVWMFGYKTESNSVSQFVKNGGKLEILGGMANQANQSFTGILNIPILRVENAQVSVSLHTNGYNEPRGYGIGVINSKSGVEKSIPWSDLAPRTTREHQIFIPLYVDAAPQGMSQSPCSI
jgi:hypothetical protein